MWMRTFLAGLGLSLLSNISEAQRALFTENGPVTLGSTYSLQSEALGEQRKFFVALPPGYENSNKRHPVVYLLDAQGFALFQYAYGEVNMLAALGEIPELILVGVPSEDRQLDMTAASTTNEGRAESFIEFFRSELQVFIDETFRTEPYTILIGHSLGGTFAVHALSQQFPVFDAYIAVSPAVGHDGQSALRAFKERLASGIGFNNAVYTSVADEGSAFSANVAEFVELIDETKPEGLELTHMLFPDETHASTIMPGIHHGLLAVYERWAPPDRAYSLGELLSHYGALSEHYGYPVAIPTEVASRVGLNLLLNKEFAAALDVFEYSIAKLAQGPAEYHQLGRALRALGRNEEALAAFENALAVGAGSPDYESIVLDRDAVAKDLAK